MKVRILLTGRTETHPDEYAARLFEQGRAVPTEEPAAPEQAQNRMRMIYDAFSDAELTKEIACLLTPVELNAELEVVFQSCEDLRRACPEHRGDWYFTGDYPTPGGVAVVNRALINFMENNHERAY